MAPARKGDLRISNDADNALIYRKDRDDAFYILYKFISLSPLSPNDVPGDRPRSCGESISPGIILKPDKPEVPIMVKDNIESCFMIPIIPDRVGNAKEFWMIVSTDKAHEVDEYARSVGQSRVISYLQHLPAGDFLVQYIRSNTDIAKAFRMNRELDTPIANYIRDAFMDFTGYDFTRPGNAPEIVKLYQWRTMEEAGGLSRKRFVFAIPLLQGRLDDVRRHFEGRKANPGQAVQNYRSQGILGLEVFTQDLRHRPGGQYAVIYMESYDDLNKVLQKIPRETKNFWIDVSGIDLSKPENVPDIELLFDWSADRGVQTAEAQKAYTV
jgi:hypothetical protein